MFGIGSGPGTAQFGHVVGVEAGSGTFHGGSRDAPVVLNMYGDDDDEDEDGDIDEDVGISEEGLELDGLVVTVDEEI